VDADAKNSNRSSDLVVTIVDARSTPVYLEIAAQAAHLRELGMSDRAIARAIGVSDKTVAKSLAAATTRAVRAGQPVAAATPSRRPDGSEEDAGRDDRNWWVSGLTRGSKDSRFGDGRGWMSVAKSGVPATAAALGPAPAISRPRRPGGPAEASRMRPGANDWWNLLLAESRAATTAC
jgi:hypothetical protein